MSEPVDSLPDAVNNLAVARGYHQRSKHRLDAFAAGPDSLDWDNQPDPFRRYTGAPFTPLPLSADSITTPWSALFVPGAIAPHAFNCAHVGLLLELSMGLSAWKQAGPDRWALRVNPSSGNLHPTEAWLLCQGVRDIADGVHHYAPRQHALEQRASIAPLPTDARSTPRIAVALSSIQWREAWKYGERAFRYCQLDVGHALGALRYAAALLGWRLQALTCGTDQLAALLGLDREADFAHAEREEPELLFELLHRDAPATASLSGWPAATAWHGTPNRLDRHPMYRWPVIDAVAQATRAPTAPTAPMLPAVSDTRAADLTTATPAVHEAGDMPAATLIRQRRSAQRFDARARMPVAQLWPLLRALQAQRLPFDGAAAQVHVLLFAHRVDGLSPGAYLLARSAAGAALLRHSLPPELMLHRVPNVPGDVPLLQLSDNPALAGTLRTLNCHQALGSDAILGFALLAEFNPLPDAHAYRQRLQEAGLIGQVLYLEAEAQGLRGTGIGCFFDDALHQLVGLNEPAGTASLQSVYHFTIGLPVSDARIATEPAYAHLLSEREGTPHG
jgi:SagB-type dehydrogenase family enzyme